MTTTIKVKNNTSKTSLTAKRNNLKKTNLRKASPVKAAEAKALQPLAFEQGEQQFLAVAEIDFSPLNYRKLYSLEALQDFAAELAIHGIISPLTVRKIPTGRFELVAGERRLRASLIAELTEVPVIVKALTDEQVTEIQLAENLQRENPHPLHEAQAVAILQKAGQTIDKIAARLGKSKAFVYTRIKLAELIEPIQEVFIADKISIKDALQIAGLEASSQQEFFHSYCEDWQTPGFNLNNVHYAVSRFRYDLNRAPFDIKNKNLVAAAGACSRCPFNSATLKSLFPELAKEAICSNKSCYQNKCLVSAEAKLRKVITQQQPDALLVTANISPDYKIILDSLPETAGLPEFAAYDVTVISHPEFPDKEDYTNDWDDKVPEFDEDGFNEAVEEYKDNVAAFNDACEQEGNLKGLYISGNTIEIRLFKPEKKTTFENAPKVTAKAVQEAIKAGTVTVELLEQEIARINSREERAKEIDQEKIQLKIYGQFKEELKEGKTEQSPTAADLTGARLIMYQSLDYYARNQADKVLFENVESSKESLYQALVDLTEQQYAYLIRLAISAKSESQYVNNVTGYCLYQMAAASGMDINTIETEQANICTEREAKLSPRVADLEKRIQKLQA